MKRHDYLYIGDGFDNTVKTFDVESGRFLGRFVPSGDNGLNGPRGLIFDISLLLTKTLSLLLLLHLKMEAF